ncbi:MAG: MarR family transcriptional regulator [Nitrospinae bacterium]|nr:MarR family transcriptional regulator [Nitrospinota bacterium]
MSKPTLTIKIALEISAREVMETVPLVMRFLRAEMRRERTRSLSVPQFRALVFLNQHPGTSLSSVADDLGVTRPTASALIDRLVRRGLVDRSEHPQERRHVVLALTPMGARHLQQGREAARARIASVLASLSAAELHKVAEGVALLGSAFKDVSTQ